MGSRVGTAMIVLLIMALGLKLTKPSLDGFESFARGEQLKPENKGLRYVCVEHNDSFVCSLFEIVEQKSVGLDFISYHKQYLGVMGMFFTLRSYKGKEQVK